MLSAEVKVIWAEPEITPSLNALKSFSSDPSAPAFQKSFVESHNNEPLITFGLVTSFTNKPPFAAPLPFNSRILSPKVIVVESTVVVVPWTSKLPTTVRLFPIVTSSGKEIVTVLSVTAVTISFAVPANVKWSFNKSNVSFPVEPLITKSVARPVSPEPSPTNEPVNVEVPASSPKLSPLTRPEPKSVAEFSNWPEPEIIPLPFVILDRETEPPNAVEFPAIVIVLFWINVPSICSEPETTPSPLISKKVL